MMLPLAVLEQEGGGTIPHLRPGLSKDTGWGSLYPVPNRHTHESEPWAIRLNTYLFLFPTKQRRDGKVALQASSKQWTGTLQQDSDAHAGAHRSRSYSLPSLALCLCAWLHMQVWLCVCGTQELVENRLCRHSGVQTSQDTLAFQ